MALAFTTRLFRVQGALVLLFEACSRSLTAANYYYDFVWHPKIIVPWLLRCCSNESTVGGPYYGGYMWPLLFDVRFSSGLARPLHTTLRTCGHCANTLSYNVCDTMQNNACCLVHLTNTTSTAIFTLLKLQDYIPWYIYYCNNISSLIYIIRSNTSHPVKDRINMPNLTHAGAHKHQEETQCTHLTNNLRGPLEKSVAMKIVPWTLRPAGRRRPAVHRP